MTTSLRPSWGNVEARSASNGLTALFAIWTSKSIASQSCFFASLSKDEPLKILR